MLAGAALRKTSLGWEFASEAALEDFVWDNLIQLLGLTPLKRQYPELGEYCDILAVDNQKQLTIIELKNIEDRYVTN
jgi:RecB family endonuclease NucS